MPWEHVNLWPSDLTAIHAVHLPNNRVAMWGFGESGSDIDCEAWILNLLNWQFAQVSCTVNNIFCAGHSMLSDGRALIAGGTDLRTDRGEGWGTRYATLLVPDGSSAGAHWEAAQEMGSVDPDDARWYPTNTHLPDGRQLVLSGTFSFPPPAYNKKVQLYNPADDSWFTAPIDQQLPLYPAMFVLPSGDVFYAGRAITPTPPGDKTLALQLSDYTWHVVTEGQSEGAIGEHNSACMFAPGKVLRCGGDDPSGFGASRLAAMIDLSNWHVGQPAPSWQTAAQMNHPRRDDHLRIGRHLHAAGHRQRAGAAGHQHRPRIHSVRRAVLCGRDALHRANGYRHLPDQLRVRDARLRPAYALRAARVLAIRAWGLRRRCSSEREPRAPGLLHAVRSRQHRLVLPGRQGAPLLGVRAAATTPGPPAPLSPSL